MNPAEQPNSNTTPTPQHSNPTPQSKQKGNGMMIFITILIICLIGGLAFVSYELFIKNTQLQSIQLAQQKTADENKIVIPKDAVQVSGCLPYMGIHWVRPQDVPHGPYYVTYNGKLTAVEYMFRPDEIPGQTIAQASPSAFLAYMSNHPLSDLTRPAFTFDLAGVNGIKFMNIEWTAPHAGFLVPHYDVHFYLVSKEETQTICPNAKLEEAQTPAIEQILRKNNIPYFPVEGSAPATQSGTTTNTTDTISAQPAPKQ
jgi:hypothetical protein